MTKIDIFSGFLGAGKTTLIKKLVKEAYNSEKIVIIENEFGEIGIDGKFLNDAGIEVTEMNSGCICCSLVGDFGEALKKVLKEYAPDRIIIEPSGVGKLSDVMKAVLNIGSDQLELNCITAVVDAKKCKMYTKNFGEFFNDQIATAKSVVLSRTGEMKNEKVAECVELVKSINDSAVIVTTDWEKLDGKKILSAIEVGFDSLSLIDEDECPVCGHHHHHDDDEECHCHDHEHEHHHHHGDDEECHCHDHEHDHEHHHHHDDDEECHCHDHEHHHNHEDGEECHCHDHDHEHHHHHHHADDVFTSWGKETAKKYTAEFIKEALEKLDDAETYGAVLRAKGIVEGEDGWIYFDHVPGEADVRVGEPDVTGRLCVIGSKINEKAIEELFGV